MRCQFTRCDENPWFLNAVTPTHRFSRRGFKSTNTTSLRSFPSPV